MALREIRIKEEQEAFLRKKSRPVTEITERIKILLDDMAETMKAANGVGLAAPQVGVLKRVIVVDIGEGLISLINPEIIEAEGEETDQEGCLSVPGLRGLVSRPKKVKVKGLNPYGEEVIIDCEGLLARAMCHEIDHLDGVLFVDKVSEYLEEDE